MRYKTDINVILDKSGSMHSLRELVVTELNKLIKDNQQNKESARFNFYQFSDDFLTKLEDTDLQLVTPLEYSDYKPSGNTRLIDAGCKFIDRIGSRLATLPPNDRPDQVIVVFVTDGEENASTKYKMYDLQRRIAHQKDKYSWQFVFVGTNENGLRESQNYAKIIGQNNVIPFNTLTRFGVSPEATTCSAFNYISEGLKSFRSTSKPNVDNFTDLTTKNEV